MLKIKSDNPNYLAEVFTLTNKAKHPNADRLSLVTHKNQTVVTSNEAKEGEKYIFFPPECAINLEFLSFCNLLDKKELNQNKEVKGFFGKHGRVRVIGLRGIASEGFIIPAAQLVSWFNCIGVKISLDNLVDGQQFDSFDDITICQKYEIPTNKQVQPEGARRQKGKFVSRLIDGQYKLSYDTKHLKREIGGISPNDIITISYKLHGTNFSCGRVLVKRKLRLVDKISKFFGAKIQETEYDLIYASRNVIKNEQSKGGYYNEDLWGIIARKISDCIPQGYSVHGEIVGFTPEGRYIQKDFDYGLEKGKMELYVYRVFYTSHTGRSFELTTPQVEQFCADHGLKMVPVFYYGRAGDWNKEIDEKAHWHENFLSALIKVYNDKNCYMCKNKVPEEGIVLSKEGADFKAFKLKSIRFLEKETKDLDVQE